MFFLLLHKYSCYKNTLYKLLLLDDTQKMSEKYDNICELKTEKNENGFIRNDSLSYIVERDRNYKSDVNSFVFNRHLTQNLTELYDKKLKHRLVNNNIRFNCLKKVF